MTQESLAQHAQLTIPRYRYGFMGGDDPTSLNKLVVFSENQDFLGYIVFTNINNLIEVTQAVARPGFGRLLYQGLAQFAYLNGAYIMSARDGDTRGGALSIWESFYNTISDEHKFKLPDFLNEEVQEDLTEEEAAPFCYAYRMPASQDFKGSLVDIKRAADPAIWQDMFALGNDIWSVSYERDDNTWINDDFPLNQETKTKASYPLTGRLDMTLLHLESAILNGVIAEVKSGTKSHSKGQPIACMIDTFGYCLLIDGWHRIAEALLAGKSTILATIIGDERIHGHIEDAERPYGRITANMRKVLSAA